MKQMFMTIHPRFHQAFLEQTAKHTDITKYFYK